MTTSHLHCLSRLGLIALTAFAVACDAEPTADVGLSTDSVARASVAAGVSVESIEREALTGGVAHYRLRVRVGDGPNAIVGLHRIVRERAPWWPRRAPAAVMLLHGDFSTFDTNFALASAPHGGLAPYLAARGVDVWGVDRRWTNAPAADADLSDFGDMGLDQAIADTRRALAFARTLRALTGSGAGRIALGGFSRGAHLTYAYAADEAARPARERHVDAIAPIDIYASLAPEHDAQREAACRRRDEQLVLMDAGEVDSDNTLFPLVADLAAAAPDEPSPIFDGYTNYQVLLALGAQTFAFYDPTPVYHLAAGADAAAIPSALLYTDEATFSDWLAGAAPHQALAEIVDSESQWCDGGLPGLADIAVPVLHTAAAGGFGDYAAHTVAQVGATDVAMNTVRLLDPAQEIEDYGHADLLYGDAAPDLAWSTLCAWVLAH